ncbi:hypothetical protein BU15DRAFT_89406 [Melanogaster broomeanus]|nr:hypothetical protein BU15DRAFT_89406 [Melanogaster broomeanus]
MYFPQWRAFWPLESLAESLSLSIRHMLSAQDIEEYIQFAKSYQEEKSSVDQGTTVSPFISSSTFSSLDFGSDAASSTISYTADPHAVSVAEAQSYYAGLHSQPTLLYRTGEQWFPPSGPEAPCRLKELCEVFTHPITKVWDHDLAWKVVDILDAHTVRFTTIDVVRFKQVGVDEEPENEEHIEGEEEVEDEETVEPKKPVAGPVTIWIGVFPGSTSATAAHNSALDVLALLRDYHITDVDIDYRESFYTREAGPQLLKPVNFLHPLVDVVSPLTPALGLRISTKARPNAQGTMALYLAEANVDYVRHPSAPSADVLLLGTRACTNLVGSIKIRIAQHGIMVKLWRTLIEGFVEAENGANTVDIEEAKAARIETQELLDKAENAMEALAALLDRLGVGEHRFTEDWGIVQVDRAKLGNGFQGNKLDLGTKLTPYEFTFKCFARGDANWEFVYPPDRLLPLSGTITASDELMHTPDMWDSNGDPCLSVVKSGSATDTTLGRANGVFSIVRVYFIDMSVHETSMEWAIINYDSKSEVFSEPGDSGSIIADIHGRIGGMLTGGSGKTDSSDMTYATPFWWLLQRIRANGFPNAHLNVFT